MEQLEVNHRVLEKFCNASGQKEGVQSNVKWNIGNGKHDFWEDPWLNETRPLLHRKITSNRTIPECSIASMVDEDGEWRWEAFEQLLPHEILLRIATSKPQKMNEERVWSSIAKRRGLPRVKTFLWLVEREALLTNGECVRRHLDANAWSKIYDNALEAVDHILQGRWILGFSKSIGCCTIMEAKLWGVYEGLNVAWNLGVQKVILETYSLEVTNMLQRNDGDSHTTLHHHISSLLKKDWEVKIEHIFREGNRIADCVARMNRVEDRRHKLYVTPPAVVLTLLQDRDAKIKDIPTVLEIEMQLHCRGSCPSIRNILLLDSEGHRVAVKYYSDDWLTNSAKEAFEKALFSKTQKTNARTEAEIAMFENHIIVYKFVQDLHFFVTGAEGENELILVTVLQGFFDAVGLLLRGAVDKKEALENLDLILLCLDEIVDGGIILETDASAIAGKVASHSVDEVAPLSEQILENDVEFGSLDKLSSGFFNFALRQLTTSFQILSMVLRKKQLINLFEAPQAANAVYDQEGDDMEVNLNGNRPKEEEDDLDDMLNFALDIKIPTSKELRGGEKAFDVHCPMLPSATTNCSQRTGSFWTLRMPLPQACQGEISWQVGLTEKDETGKLILGLGVEILRKPQTMLKSHAQGHTGSAEQAVWSAGLAIAAPTPPGGSSRQMCRAKIMESRRQLAKNIFLHLARF
ncbi:Coatomer subunit zeta-2 [Hibiscus syriacus]|uniref:Coatomer subunit zeta-2 n=1 Tax=Hibiscus syriacus TaxID=106335 RepID=A0A6A3CEY2_HIBSY|nr:Coatomer subunit zeta-2 [Hibiscus syriacus]